MRKLLPLLFLALIGAMSVSAQEQKTDNQEGKPTDSVKTFYTLICNDEIDVALKMFSKKINAPAYRLRGVLEFGAKECRDNKGIKSIEIAEEKIKGKTATVSGEKVFQNGEKRNLMMKLVFEEDTWKITFTPPK